MSKKETFELTFVDEHQIEHPAGLYAAQGNKGSFYLEGPEPPGFLLGVALGCSQNVLYCHKRDAYCFDCLLIEVSTKQALYKTAFVPQGEGDVYFLDPEEESELEHLTRFMIAEFLQKRVEQICQEVYPKALKAGLEDSDIFNVIEYNIQTRLDFPVYREFLDTQHDYGVTFRREFAVSERSGEILFISLAVIFSDNSFLTISNRGKVSGQVTSWSEEEGRYVHLQVPVSEAGEAGYLN